MYIYLFERYFKTQVRVIINLILFNESLSPFTFLDSCKKTYIILGGIIKKIRNLPLILVSCGSKGGNRGCVCCPGFFNRTPTTCGGGIIILASLPSCFLSLLISVVRHITLAHIPLSFAIVFTNRRAGFRWKPLRVFFFSFGCKKESRNSFKQQLPMFVVDLLGDREESFFS